MDNLGVSLRQHGYFSQRYSILPGESRAQFGSSSAPASRQSASNLKNASSAASTSSAGGITDLTDEQFICAFHNTTKRHCAKSEREKGPRLHVRRLSFCFRHKRGAVEEEGKALFAARCMDAGFPQLKLWMALHEAVALERVPVKLQAVTDAWVEIEETVAAASSNLIPVTPQDKNNYSLEAYQRRQARRLLGIDDDEEENLIQSLMQMEETRLHAYVAFERCPRNTMSLREINKLKLERVDQQQQHQQQQQCKGPLKSGADVTTEDGAFNNSTTSNDSSTTQPKAKQATVMVPTGDQTTSGISDDFFCKAPPMPWSSAELTLILSHLSQFAKLTTQFTRKGTRRRSGAEPTIMLDIDEDHIYGQLDEDEPASASRDRTPQPDTVDLSEATGSSISTGIPRVFRVFLSVGVIETCCRLRDNRYVQSPSIALIQHDFDASVWNRACFPTATPLTGAGAEAAQQQNQKSNVHQNPANEAARQAMVGIKTSMFLLGLMLFRYSVREDCDISTLRLTLPMKKPAFLLDDDGQFRHEATYRSVLMQLVDGEDVNRPGPSQVLEALREEGCGTYRSRRGSVLSPSAPLSSSSTSPLRPRLSPTMPVSPPKGEGPRSLAVGSRSRHQPASPPHAKLASGRATNSMSEKILQEHTVASMMTLAQRQQEHKAQQAQKQHNNALLALAAGDDNNKAADRMQKAIATETKFEATQRDAIRKLFESSAHPFPPTTAIPEVNDSALLWFSQGAASDVNRSPTVPHGRPETRATATRSSRQREDHNGAVSGGPLPSPSNPPGSSESTRQTAETPANDTRPQFTSSSPASRTPVSVVFEL